MNGDVPTKIKAALSRHPMSGRYMGPGKTSSHKLTLPKKPKA